MKGNIKSLYRWIGSKRKTRENLSLLQNWVIKLAIKVKEKEETSFILDFAGKKPFHISQASVAGSRVWAEEGNYPQKVHSVNLSIYKSTGPHDTDLSVERAGQFYFVLTLCDIWKSLSFKRLQVTEQRLMLHIWVQLSDPVSLTLGLVSVGKAEDAIPTCLYEGFWWTSSLTL